MDKFPDIIDAIIFVYPDASFTLKDTSNLDTIIWHDDKKYNLSLIKETYENLIVLFNNKEYSRLRKNEYPSIGDQLDALYHAGVFPEDMANKIKAIKNKYPKTI